MRQSIVLILVMLALSACSRSQHFHARDISGLMPVLDFKLTDDNGHTVTAKDFRGKDVLLFFGYTSCPDFCPATLMRLHKAFEGMPASARKSLRVLFVSVDPKRDTPAKLKKFTHYFGPEITGLTGSIDALRDLTKRYRTTFSYGPADAHGNYVVTHGLAVYAFNREGKVKLMILNTEPVPQLSEDLTHLTELAHS